MIIGVALVVDDLNKGQKLVYRYPESIPSALFDLSNEALVKFHRDYLSFSPDNFAKLFRPKSSHYNQVLDLVIDDLHYISFPCPCKFGSSAERNDQLTGIDNINLFNVVITKVRDSAMNKFLNLDGGGYSRERDCDWEDEDVGVGGERDWNYLLDPGVDPISVAMGLRERFQKEVSLGSIKDVVQAFSQALLHLERNQAYVSSQVALMFDIIENGHRLKSNSSSTIQGVSSIFSGSSGSSEQQQRKDTSISPEDEDKRDSTASAEHSQSEASRPLAHRVQIDDETVRGGPTSTSATGPDKREPSRTVITIDRNMITADEVDQYYQGGGGVLMSQAGSGAGAGDEYEYGAEDLEGLEVLLQHSTLANELRRLYHGLIGGHSVVLSVNKAIDLNIKLVSKAESDALKQRRRQKADRKRDSDWAKGEGEGEGEGEDEDESSSNRPISILQESVISTLLPVGNADELSTVLQGQGQGDGAVGINPRLVMLLSACNVTRSVAEISADMDMTVEEVHEMGRHLQAWGLAFFIPVLTKSSVLQVRSQASVDSHSQVAKAFDATFLRPLFDASDDRTRDSRLLYVESSDAENRGSPDGHDDFFSTELFQSLDTRPPYSLVCFMAIFDGHRTLSQAVQLVPSPLQEHTLDMVVWLLRRKLIYVRDPRIMREELDVAMLLKQKYPL